MVTLTQEHIKLPAPCFCAHSNCLVWTGVLQSEAKIVISKVWSFSRFPSRIVRYAESPTSCPPSIDGGVRYPICQEAGEARDVFSANQRDFLFPFVADHLI